MTQKSSEFGSSASLWYSRKVLVDAHRDGNWSNLQQQSNVVLAVSVVCFGYRAAAAKPPPRGWSWTWATPKDLEKRRERARPPSTAMRSSSSRGGNNNSQEDGRSSSVLLRPSFSCCCCCACRWSAALIPTPIEYEYSFSTHQIVACAKLGLPLQ